MAGARPDLIATSITPDLLFRSHSAPLGLAFYPSGNFPEHFQGGAFIALHGSWNAETPRGYKIVFVPFACGRPDTGYENFATGFRTADGAAPNANVIGRPVGLAVAADGALLVADDTANVIWRIAYIGGSAVSWEERQRVNCGTPAQPPASPSQLN